MQQSDPTNTNTDLRALEIELMDRRNSLGSSHMGVAETLNIMGLTHHHMTHNQTEALRCHQEALQILKMQRGGDIPDYYTALTQCDIGNTHWKMGNYLEAGIAYTEAMNLFERTKTKKANPGLQMASRRIVMLGIESTPEKTPQQEPNKLSRSRHLTTSDCQGQEDKTPKSHRSARERVDSTVLLPAKKRKLDRDSHSPQKKRQGVALVPGYYLTGHNLDDAKVASGDLLAGLSHSSCPSLGASNRVTKNPRDALVCVGSTVLLPTKKRKLDGDSSSPKKNNQNVVLLSGYLTRLEILKSKGHHQDVNVASGDLLAGLHHSSCPSLMGASKPVGAKGA
eukprot:scaffold187882_cov50-Attheya_sp.AAC.3